MTEETSCPECSKTLPLVDTGKEQFCPFCNHQVTNLIKEKGDGETNANETETETEIQAHALAERLARSVELLPPKFLADDPDFIDYRVNRTSATKVLLPDASGGVQSVDSNIVRIQHKGKTIELVALTPEQRRKRQRIINIVSIVVGCVFLALFFLWLNQ